jgi:hypothetical protein
LSFKYFGPFKVLERVGQVAYKLDLPASSRIHPVFHVSRLKPRVSPEYQVSAQLPPADHAFQVPVHILQTRAHAKGHHTVAQVLVRWSGLPDTAATWEDLEALCQLFPHAPAWGQEGFQGGGIVSDHAPPASETDANANNDVEQVKEVSSNRPTRQKRAPAWLANDEWDLRVT